MESCNVVVDRSVSVMSPDNALSFGQDLTHTNNMILLICIQSVL